MCDGSDFLFCYNKYWNESLVGSAHGLAMSYNMLMGPLSVMFFVFLHFLLGGLPSFVFYALYSM